METHLYIECLGKVWAGNELNHRAPDNASYAAPVSLYQTAVLLVKKTRRSGSSRLNYISQKLWLVFFSA